MSARYLKIDCDYAQFEVSNKKLNYIKFYHFSFAFLILLAFSSFNLSADIYEESCPENYQLSARTSIHNFSDGEIGGFNSEYLYLLDEVNNIYLFRGDLPQRDNSFCYNDLTTAIKVYLQNLEKPVPDDFKIFDICLLNHLAESEEIDIEKNWFHLHSETGKFRLHPLYGALINPCLLPKKIRDLTIHFDDIDGLKHLMKKLHKLLSSKSESNLVIYIHCKAGKDRTGEASACYLMEYQGYSYQDALALDLKIAKRDLRSLSINAIRWYAYYLKDVKHMHTIGEIN